MFLSECSNLSTCGTKRRRQVNIRPWCHQKGPSGGMTVAASVPSEQIQRQSEGSTLGFWRQYRVGAGLVAVAPEAMTLGSRYSEEQTRQA